MLQGSKLRPLRHDFAKNLITVMDKCDMNYKVSDFDLGAGNKVKQRVKRGERG